VILGVSRDLDEGYSFIATHKLVCLSDGAKFECAWVRKGAFHIGLAKAGSGKNMLRYCVLGLLAVLRQKHRRNSQVISSTVRNRLSYHDDDTTDQHVYHRDLAFYADVLGQPNSATHWCHLCDLSWHQWNADPKREGVEWHWKGLANTKAQEITRA